jgi:hypothetical protein
MFARCGCETQSTAARNAHDLKVNVYRNYTEYIRTAQVISKLEGELRTVETLLVDHRVGLHSAQVAWGPFVLLSALPVNSCSYL